VPPDRTTATDLDSELADQSENPIRRALISRLVHPALTMDAHMISPLYKVLRGSRNIRGDPENRRWWQKNVRVLDAWVKRVRQYQQEEWVILTGKEWQTRYGETELEMPLDEGIVQVDEDVLNTGSFESAFDSVDNEQSGSRGSVRRTSRTSGPIPPGFFTSEFVDRLGLVPSLQQIGRDKKASPARQLKKTIWSHIRTPSDPRFSLRNHLETLEKAGWSLEKFAHKEAVLWGNVRRKDGFLKKAARKRRSMEKLERDGGDE
jgi:hypothetical protein